MGLIGALELGGTLRGSSAPPNRSSILKGLEELLIADLGCELSGAMVVGVGRVFGFGGGAEEGALRGSSISPKRSVTMDLGLLAGAEAGTFRASSGEADAIDDNGSLGKTSFTSAERSDEP